MASSYVVRYGQMRFLGEFSGPERPGASPGAAGRHPERSRHGAGRGALPGHRPDGAVPRESGPGGDPPRRLARGPGGRGPARRRPGGRVRRLPASSSPSAGSRWTWSTSRSSSAASGWSSTTWPRSGSTSASWSRTWPAPSRPGSRCARSASATRPSSWPITAIAASRSAATPTCRGCPRSRCGWPSSKKRRSTPRKSRGGVVGSSAACDTSLIPTKLSSANCRPSAREWSPTMVRAGSWLWKSSPSKVVVEFEDRRRIVIAPDEILGVEKSKARPLRDEDDDRIER